MGGEERSPAEKPRKKNHLLILVGVLVALLVMALTVMVVLITRLPASQDISKGSESVAHPTATIAPQAGETIPSASVSPNNHQIAIDSVYLSETDVEFRWGAAIDQTGTVWFWDQNDYIARPSDITDAAAIYTAGVDWTARLYVVKQDGTVWWTEVYWENNSLKYGLQQIQGLWNIVDLEIIDSYILGLLALDSQGQVWAYGVGKYGVFAMGEDQHDYASPVAIEGLPPIQKIQSIYSDFDPGFGMVVAQATSGEFYYWGTNLFASDSEEYSNTPVPIDFATASSNWSLFESVQITKSAYFAWLNEQGYLSIYENQMQPTDYSELGSFIYQRGGISGLYLLNESGSVYGYGYYTSGCPLTGAFIYSNQPAAAYELSDNQSIAAVAFGGWETTALYQDGRIGIWEQSGGGNDCITDVRFIQSEAGGDFKLATSSVNGSVAVQSDSSIQFGDVSLTVESTCDYSVNLIPTNRNLQPNSYSFEGLTFDTNQINIEITDDSLMIDYFGYLGAPVNGAQVQLFNKTDQKKWQATTKEFYGMINFDALTPGTYYYTVTCEGYETYTSPEFKVEYSSGKDNDNAYMQCILQTSENVFSNGFQIQVTDLAGNLIVSQPINEVVLHSCVRDSSSYRIWSGLVLGSSTNQEGILGDFTSFQFSLKRGSMAIITFDGITTWDGNGVMDHYILIRAE